MTDEELRAVDADHFWIGRLLVDLNQLRHEANSITGRKGVSIAQIHDISASLMMLERYAAGLADPNHRYADLVSPEKVAKYLKMANEAGLHTGYVDPDRKAR